MMVFLMLKVVMVRGRRLKKGVGDFKAHKQNVPPSKLKPGEQNVVPSKLRIDESNNLCGLKLTMVIICNSNGEIILNIDREF
jgi:hypothetical protein